MNQGKTRFLILIHDKLAMHLFTYVPPYIAAFFLRLVCTNGMVSKTEISSSYRHVSTKILNEFPEVIQKVSGELAGKRDQFKLSIESPVDNPESTIETFNRQFQLGKVEKDAVEWAWPLEAGDTMFNVVNTPDGHLKIPHPWPGQNPPPPGSRTKVI